MLTNNEAENNMEKIKTAFQFHIMYEISVPNNLVATGITKSLIISKIYIQMYILMFE